MRLSWERASTAAYRLQMTPIDEVWERGDASAVMSPTFPYYFPSSVFTCYGKGLLLTTISHAFHLLAIELNTSSY